MIKRKFFLKKSFTFVEVLVALGVTGIIAMAAFAALNSWQRSWNINEVQMDVQFEARRAMARMSGELMQTSATTISINAAGDTIIFQLPNNDYSAGVFTWGDQIQYSLEVTGGVQQLVRTNLTNNQVEVLASYVNAAQFNLNNDAVGIQLIMSKALKGDNSQIQLNSQVSLRNL